MNGRWSFARAALGLWLGVTVTGCASDGVPPASPSRDPAAIVTDVLELSGTKPGLTSMARGLRPVVATLSGVEVFGDAHVVAPLLEREITMERLYAAFSAYLVEHFDRERLAPVERRLREPLIRRMTALEVAASRVETATITAWAQSAHETDAGRERVALARRIDAAVGATGATLDVLFAAGRGVLLAFSAVVPPGRRLAPDSFRADLARLEPEIRASTEAAIAYAHRDAPVAEVERYAEQLESEPLRWFSALQRRAAVHAAQQVTQTAMQRLIEVRRMPRT